MIKTGKNGKKRHVSNQFIPSDYDPEVHPNQLIELMSEGANYSYFCSKNHICEKTFFNWVNAHPEFMAAYDIAKAKARSWLEEIARTSLTSPHFQATVWSMMMRTRCRMSEHRTVQLDFTKCKSATEKMKVLEKEINEGNLTTAEAKHLAEFIKCGAEVHEKTEIAKQVDELLKLAGKSK